mgnify:CR=1 FL=1
MKSGWRYTLSGRILPVSSVLSKLPVAQLTPQPARLGWAPTVGQIFGLGFIGASFLLIFQVCLLFLCSTFSQLTLR